MDRSRGSGPPLFRIVQLERSWDPVGSGLRSVSGGFRAFRGSGGVHRFSWGFAGISGGFRIIYIGFLVGFAGISGGFRVYIGFLVGFAGVLAGILDGFWFDFTWVWVDFRISLRVLRFARLGLDGFFDISSLRWCFWRERDVGESKSFRQRL